MPVPVEPVIDRLGTLARGLALWSGVLLLLASALSFYQGWERRKLSSLVDETSRRDVAAVDPPGTVRIRGEIVPRSETETFASPITGEENCVLAAWEIEELYDTPKREAWEKSAWGVRAVPFYLSDGTEKILVDIDDEVVGNETDDVFTPEAFLTSEGVSLEELRCAFAEFDVRVETDYEEPPTGRIAEFLQDTDGLSVDPMVTALGSRVVTASKRKYREQTLQPGDRVSIVGDASPRREGTESAVYPSTPVLAPTAETPLRLSEQPFDEIADAGGALLFGVLTGVVGIALLSARIAF